MIGDSDIDGSFDDRDDRNYDKEDYIIALFPHYFPDYY